MENLIFSLNIIMPIFFLTILGAFLKSIGILTEEFRAKAMTLVFYVSLPVSLFSSVAEADIYSGFSLKFVIYSLVSTLVVFIAGWILTLIFIKDKKQISAVVHGCFRGNFAYIGLAVCKNMLETDVLISAVMVIAFVVPLYNVLGTFVLTYYDPSGQRVSAKKLLMGIVKNPLIIAIVLALPFSLFSIEIPTMFDKTLGYVGQLATPLALLLIGANLNLSSFKKKPKGIVLSSVIKIVLSPLAGTYVAYLLGFTGEDLVTLFVMYGVPSAANTFIMTKQLGGDAEVGAGIVMVSTLASTITLTIGIYIFKVMGWI